MAVEEVLFVYWSFQYAHLMSSRYLIELSVLQFFTFPKVTNCSQNKGILDFHVNDH